MAKAARFSADKFAVRSTQLTLCKESDPTSEHLDATSYVIRRYIFVALHEERMPEHCESQLLRIL